MVSVCQCLDRVPAQWRLALSSDTVVSVESWLLEAGYQPSKFPTLDVHLPSEETINTVSGDLKHLSLSFLGK